MMFERFNNKARRVVVLAQEDARLLDHNYIGTEHLLLGLLHDEEEIPFQVLAELGLTLFPAREAVEALIGRGTESPPGHIPFTPRAKKVLELSLREALQLGHNYIGTEHILLGLIREGEGVAAKVIVGAGIDLAAVRQGVIKVLTQRSPLPSPVSHPSSGDARLEMLEKRRTDLVARLHEFVDAAKHAAPEVSWDLRKVGNLTVVRRVTSEIVATFADPMDAAAVMENLLQREREAEAE
jgi:ATP-dependent Clp protease ATP-binding subunit ClpA